MWKGVKKKRIVEEIFFLQNCIIDLEITHYKYWIQSVLSFSARQALGANPRTFGASGL